MTKNTAGLPKRAIACDVGSAPKIGSNANPSRLVTGRHWSEHPPAHTKAQCSERALPGRSQPTWGWQRQQQSRNQWTRAETECASKSHAHSVIHLMTRIEGMAKDCGIL